MRRATLAGLAILVVGGCDVPGATTRPTTGPGGEQYRTPRMTVTGNKVGPADGRPAVAGVVRVDVYLVDVPAGTISGDAAFWRTVDETAVGTTAGNRLGENGLRCGVALRREWPRFAALIAKQMSHSRHAKTGTVGVTSLTGESAELALDEPVEHENVFVVTPDGQLAGHTYDDAVNGVTMNFGPTPGSPGSVRLSFCPTVKRDERRLQFTPLNQEFEQTTTDTVRLYDAGLTADVKPDEFFVVAPGPKAYEYPDSLGGRFLVRHDPAAEREQVILAMPTVVPLNGSSMNAER